MKPLYFAPCTVLSLTQPHFLSRWDAGVIHITRLKYGGWFTGATLENLCVLYIYLYFNSWVITSPLATIESI